MREVNVIVRDRDVDILATEVVTSRLNGISGHRCPLGDSALVVVLGQGNAEPVCAGEGDVNEHVLIRIQVATMRRNLGMEAHVRSLGHKSKIPRTEFERHALFSAMPGTNVVRINVVEGIDDPWIVDWLRKGRGYAQEEKGKSPGELFQMANHH